MEHPEEEHYVACAGAKSPVDPVEWLDAMLFMFYLLDHNKEMVAYMRTVSANQQHARTDYPIVAAVIGTSKNE